MLPTDKQDRKERPVARGVLDYFPDAIAEVAHLSYTGNQQHNPGEELHWAREKSADHADCIVRHLMERGKLDADGMRHTAKVAWRALAMLQLELENGVVKGDYGETMAKMADEKAGRCVSVDDPDKVYFIHHPALEPAVHLPAAVGRTLNSPEHAEVVDELVYRGVKEVAAEIAAGVTLPVHWKEPYDGPWCYLAGKMRGVPEFNFPAFDRYRDLLVQRGYAVISPADIDRSSGDQADDDDEATERAKEYVYRDTAAIQFLEPGDDDFIAVIPGWEDSGGATAEVMLAKWLGLPIRDAGTSHLIYHMQGGTVTRKFCEYQSQFK